MRRSSDTAILQRRFVADRTGPPCRARLPREEPFGDGAFFRRKETLFQEAKGRRCAAVFVARPLIVSLVVVLAIAVCISFFEREPRTAVSPDHMETRQTGAGASPDRTADDVIDDASKGGLRPEIL
jgi:hypothetical protein